MRGWLCLQLGTWHPYKQANCVLWSHWGPTIFGPLFHELIPNSNFNKKAKLSTKFLNIARLSYPAWKSELLAARVNIEAKNVDAVAKSHLRDLTMLMEYFIPVVSELIDGVCIDVININETIAVMDGIILFIMFGYFININEMQDAY